MVDGPGGTEPKYRLKSVSVDIGVTGVRRNLSDPSEDGVPET